ncbi:GGDEF domain-containing protein [Sphingomonas sp. MMS24-J13]|uniref:GGDEF domain-containing protein n=1 Tax=Sphingomonas sp. MMS24-J13 TaxID=3238686 RepID=UPI00384D9CE2
MSGNFAFLLPIMMATFGCAFIAAWRWGAASAAWWGAGYLCAAVAFCIPLVPHAVPVAIRSAVANALFGISFLLYGQALQVRLGELRIGWRRPLVLILSIAGCVIAQHLHNLWGELVSSDLGCALLIAIPMRSWRRHIALPGGKLLMITTCLAVFDNVSRASTVFLTVPANGGSLLATLYGFLMQSMAMVFGMMMALAALRSIVVEALERYRNQALIDPLSGVFNRRGFEAALAGQSLPGSSIVLCDIDRFKAINDRFGHDAGDKVIAALAQTIRTNMPIGATAARIGGEEFVVHLPGMAPAAAALFADQMRLAFTARDWRAIGLDLDPTASFGVAPVAAHDASVHDAIRRADARLYEAKQSGRNRVSVTPAAVLVAA